jgi:hypothetical protein
MTVCPEKRQNNDSSLEKHEKKVRSQKNYADINERHLNWVMQVTVNKPHFLPFQSRNSNSRGILPVYSMVSKNSLSLVIM